MVEIYGLIADVHYGFNTGDLGLTIVERTGLIGTGRMTLKLDKPASKILYKQLTGKNPTYKSPSDITNIVNALLKKEIKMTIG